MPTPFERPPLHDPQYLLTVKNALQDLWHELPAEHQATMILALLKHTLETEYHDWIVDAVTRLFLVGKGADGMD